MKHLSCLWITTLVAALFLWCIGCMKESPAGPSPSTAGPILFISDMDGSYQLYCMKENGSEIQQLTNDANFPIEDAKYSPEESRVVVTSSVGGAEFYGPALYVMNLDGTARVKLTQARNSHPEYASGIRPVWSSIGESIAFSRLMAPEARGNYNLFTINSDGSGEIEITHTQDTSEYLGDWTTNGKGFVCTIFTLGGGSPLEYARLALFDLSGAINFEWYEAGKTISWPVLSPSGREIACSSSDRGGTQDIFVIRTDSIQVKRKVSHGENLYTVPIGWSPDGKCVLYNAGGGDALGRPFGKILLANVETREITDITPFLGTGAYSYATCWGRR